MLTAMRCLLLPLPLALGLPGLCAAQAAPPVAANATYAASAASAAERQPARAEKTVIEDDKVRIEESRLRGQTQRITVHSKIPGAKPYEITVAPGGKDTSQDKGTVGKPAWSIFAF